MNKYLVLIVLIVSILGLSLFLLYPGEKTIYTMWTALRVKGDGREVAIAEARRLNDLFNRFDPSSEVAAINLAAGLNPVKVSRETFDVIALSLLIADLSGGAFDISLGEHGNWREIKLNSQAETVFLALKGMKIDLGGIGKGFAIEKIKRLLGGKKGNKTLVDMRSSIAAIGRSWKIGVLDPRLTGAGGRDRILGAVILNDGETLATSGGYEQPGHIIDPRSGQKAEKCLGVTVIAQDAAIADALATAIFVLGPEKGMALAEKLAARAVIIDRKGKIYDNFGFKLR
ncbi:MAG: FAD:protein FMN transferase [Candidatus Margulisbacteria bacterium]|nr:FAD:protein FMN transferase [Candidatus Margulisiibacteriota bacterium]